MPSDTLKETMESPLRQTIGDLNKSLVSLQDIYEGIDTDLIESNGEVNPFEYYDPKQDEEGIRSLSKEVVSKVNFLKQRLIN